MAATTMITNDYASDKSAGGTYNVPADVLPTKMFLE